MAIVKRFRFIVKRKVRLGLRMRNLSVNYIIFSEFYNIRLFQMPSSLTCSKLSWFKPKDSKVNEVTWLEYAKIAGCTVAPFACAKKETVKAGESSSSWLSWMMRSAAPAPASPTRGVWKIPQFLNMGSASASSTSTSAPASSTSASAPASSTSASVTAGRR